MASECNREIEIFGVGKGTYTGHDAGMVGLGSNQCAGTFLSTGMY